ncbi:unnamed protein product [Anisakis simplex]|uniref:Secreted protein n=1 Tax=Anisakis simplex TaxID=6269 RepID=A0A0M3JMP3_ANISI|nr:unnamed protein product [Anisakis simplex]
MATKRRQVYWVVVVVELGVRLRLRLGLKGLRGWQWMARRTGLEALGWLMRRSATACS